MDISRAETSRFIKSRNKKAFVKTSGNILSSSFFGEPILKLLEKFNFPYMSIPYKVDDAAGVNRSKKGHGKSKINRTRYSDKSPVGRLALIYSSGTTLKSRAAFCIVLAIFA